MKRGHPLLQPHQKTMNHIISFYIEYNIFRNSKIHTLSGKGFLLFLLQEYFENLCPTNMGLARKQFSCSKKVFSFPFSLKTDQILKDLLKYLGFPQGSLPLLFRSSRNSCIIPDHQKTHQTSLLTPCDPGG